MESIDRYDFSFLSSYLVRRPPGLPAYEQPAVFSLLQFESGLQSAESVTRKTKEPKINMGIETSKSISESFGFRYIRIETQPVT